MFDIVNGVTRKIYNPLDVTALADTPNSEAFSSGGTGLGDTGSLPAGLRATAGRVSGQDVQLSYDAYGICLGPRCSYASLLIVSGNDVMRDSINGSLRTSDIIEVTAERPWIGLLKRGRYRIYCTNPVPTIAGVLSDWTSNPSRLFNGQAGANSALSGYENATQVDVIFLHDIRMLPSMPTRRPPWEVEYMNQWNNTKWRIGADATQLALYVHSEGRVRADITIRQPIVTDDTLAVQIYGMTNVDAGTEVFGNLRNLMDVGAAQNVNIDFTDTGRYDGYIIGLTFNHGTSISVRQFVKAKVWDL